MVLLAAMLLCTTTLGGDLKPVDFKLDPAALAAPPSPHQSSGAAAEADSEDIVPTPLQRPRFRLAAGFGHDVPLDFAIRQVVPPYVKVAFADDVDRTTLVSWQGGRPWNDVIRTTVKPLGLHVTLSPGIVRISN